MNLIGVLPIAAIAAMVAAHQWAAAGAVVARPGAADSKPGR